MLRPATPLTVLLFAAFALLLISVLSTPIIKGIPLATEAGVDFGVFGFCAGSQCSSVEIGYSTNELTATQNASFDLPVSARKTLSVILIVHPIAAFFALLMLILAASAHFHSPSHSPRYLLGMFILSILTLLISLLAFLVDVLLFVPHMAWGSYIVLAATILIAISGIVSCAMRRTLVSRKARKKRIAENAEMSGENYYNRQNGATIPAVATAPMVSGALGTETKETGFASFDLQKSNTDPSRTSDERMPLTRRTPSNPSSNGPNTGISGSSMGGIDGRYRGPTGGAMNGGGGRQFNGSRDEFGNPIPPPGAFGGPPRSRDPSQESRMRNPYAGPGGPMMRGRGGPVMRGRGGYGPPGRGGYGPPGRGGYGPPRGGYGPPPGRGGYGPGPNSRGGMMGPMAGGMAAGMMGRGRGPPPGYSNGYNGPPQGYGPRKPSPPNGDYGRRPSDPNVRPYGYGRDPSPGPPNAQGYVAYPGSSRSQSMDLPRAESPPPLPGMNNSPPRALIGQAVEMDATTGSPSHSPPGFVEYDNAPEALRDSDGDLAGMVGLQQSGLPAHLRPGTERVTSDTSFYSSSEPYVPPRQAWGDAGPPINRDPSPLNSASIPPEPVELDASPTTLTHEMPASDDYYEDVDPRFVEPELQPRSQSSNSHPGSYAGSRAGSQRGGSRNGPSPPPLQLPNPQMPGVAAYNPNIPPSKTMGGLHPLPTYDGADYDDDDDDLSGLPPGARSPAESEGEQSNFTSISQRGVNPRWQGDGGPIPRRPLPPRNDNQGILLNSNPDFELPGAGPIGRGFAGRGNNGRGLALPRGGLIGGGPYPGS